MRRIPFLKNSICFYLQNFISRWNDIPSFLYRDIQAQRAEGGEMEYYAWIRTGAQALG